MESGEGEAEKERRRRVEEENVSTHTLLASRTTGMLSPLGRKTFESKSDFHRSAAWYVATLVRSNTTKAPTASL